MLTTYWSTLSYRGLGSLCGGAQQLVRWMRTCTYNVRMHYPLSGRECVFLGLDLRMSPQSDHFGDTS